MSAFCLSYTSSDTSTNQSGKKNNFLNVKKILLLTLEMIFSLYNR